MTDLFNGILWVTIAGSVPALFLFLFQSGLRRHMSPRWVYMLWFPIVLRMLLPGVPGLMTLSVPNREAVMTAQVMEVQADAGGEWMAFPQTKTGMDVASEAAAAAVWPGMNHLLALLPWIWVFTAVSLFVHRVLTYRNFIRSVRVRALPVVDEEILDLYGQWADRLKIRRIPRLYSISGLEGPMIAGMFRPRIFIPEECFLNSTVLPGIFLHELVHYSRKDVAVKWAVQLMTSLHWFNPAAWRIEREMSRCCELACDAQVMEVLGVQGITAYGDALLFSMELCCANPLDFRLAMCENAEFMRERLDGILHHGKKCRKGSAWAWGGLFLCCVSSFLLGMHMEKNFGLVSDGGQEALHLQMESIEFYTDAEKFQVETGVFSHSSTAQESVSAVPVYPLQAEADVLNEQNSSVWAAAVEEPGISRSIQVQTE